MATVTSPFTKKWGNKPAYKYIRESDKLPTYAELPDHAIAKVKLFNPTGGQTWWIASYDPDTGIAFGVAEIFEKEMGDIYLPELLAFTGVMGLPIERDIHFSPTSLQDILSK